MEQHFLHNIQTLLYLKVISPDVEPPQPSLICPSTTIKNVITMVTQNLAKFKQLYQFHLLPSQILEVPPFPPSAIDQK